MNAVGTEWITPGSPKMLKSKRQFVVKETKCISSIRRNFRDEFISDCYRKIFFLTEHFQDLSKLVLLYYSPNQRFICNFFKILEVLTPIYCKGNHVS